MTRDEVDAWRIRSREAQGLPEAVHDAVALAAVARLLTALPAPSTTVQGLHPKEAPPSDP